MTNAFDGCRSGEEHSGWIRLAFTFELRPSATHDCSLSWEGAPSATRSPLTTVSPTWRLTLTGRLASISRRSRWLIRHRCSWSRRLNARPSGTPVCALGRRRPRVCGLNPVEIARFYSAAPWIGRGVGAALMTACLREAEARACDVVWLDVWDRNARAIAFYSKWGFEVVGEADFILGDDVQHDLLMARVSGEEEYRADGQTVD